MNCFGLSGIVYCFGGYKETMEEQGGEVYPFNDCLTYLIASLIGYKFCEVLHWQCLILLNLTEF